jgi:hypothetical protein
MTMRKIRAALRAKFGHRGYRITRDGQVHYYQFSPPSGWRYYGTLTETISDIERGIL